MGLFSRPLTLEAAKQIVERNGGEILSGRQLPTTGFMVFFMSGPLADQGVCKFRDEEAFRTTLAALNRYEKRTTQPGLMFTILSLEVLEFLGMVEQLGGRSRLLEQTAPADWKVYGVRDSEAGLHLNFIAFSPTDDRALDLLQGFYFEKFGRRLSISLIPEG